MQDSLGLTYLSTSLSLPLLASPPPYHSPCSPLHLPITPPSHISTSLSLPLSHLSTSLSTPPSHLSTSLSLPLLTSPPLCHSPFSHLHLSINPLPLLISPPLCQPPPLLISLSLPLLISPPPYHSPFSSLHLSITPPSHLSITPLSHHSISLSLPFYFYSPHPLIIPG